MASSGKRGNPALYGGMPDAPGPAGMAPRLLEFADELRREAIRAGSDGEMRDLARLAIAAFGRQGEGSGVIGVDVQRIRRTLGLKAEKTGGELHDPDAVPRDELQEFEQHVRRELERQMIERTQALPPAKPLREFDRALPSNPAQDLS